MRHGHIALNGRKTDIPSAIAKVNDEVAFTPLGAKGAGEGAIHTTPAVILCAINDALAPLGVRAKEVPVTPNRLWKLIQGAKRQA